jgi:hypothetical protein
VKQNIKTQNNSLKKKKKAMHLASQQTLGGSAQTARHNYDGKGSRTSTAGRSIMTSAK